MTQQEIDFIKEQFDNLYKQSVKISEYTPVERRIVNTRHELDMEILNIILDEAKNISKFSLLKSIKSYIINRFKNVRKN